MYALPIRLSILLTFGQARSLTVQVHRAKRLYAALALCDIQQHGPVKLDHLAQIYKTDAGELQSLYKSTQAMCHVVARFAEELGWTALRSVVLSFSTRLDLQKELHPLMQVAGMTLQTARALHSQDLTTPYAVTCAELNTLAHILQLSATFRVTVADDDNKTIIFQRMAAMLRKRAAECLESTQAFDALEDR